MEVFVKNCSVDLIHKGLGFELWEVLKWIFKKKRFTLLNQPRYAIDHRQTPSQHFIRKEKVRHTLHSKYHSLRISRLLFLRCHLKELSPSSLAVSLYNTSLVLFWNRSSVVTNGYSPLRRVWPLVFSIYRSKSGFNGGIEPNTMVTKISAPAQHTRLNVSPVVY